MGHHSPNPARIPDTPLTFDADSLDLIREAVYEARRIGCGWLGVDFLLMAATRRQPQWFAPDLQGEQLDNLRRRIRGLADTNRSSSEETLHLTPRARGILESSAAGLPADRSSVSVDRILQALRQLVAQDRVLTLLYGLPRAWCPLIQPVACGEKPGLELLSGRQDGESKPLNGEPPDSLTVLLRETGLSDHTDTRFYRLNESGLVEIPGTTRPQNGNVIRYGSGGFYRVCVEPLATQGNPHAATPRVIAAIDSLMVAAKEGRPGPVAESRGPDRLLSQDNLSNDTVKTPPQRIDGTPKTGGSFHG